MKTTGLTCYYCLSDGSSLRVDVKGRGYFSCVCGARSFICAWRDVVRTLALVQPLAAARAEEIERDRDAAADAATLEAQMGAAVRAMLRARREGATTAETDAPGALAAGGRR
jgi:hypothetical protein